MASLLVSLKSYDDGEIWEIEFHDDISYGVRSLTLEKFDDYTELTMAYDIVYRDCPDIHIGTAYCFKGIIVDIVDGYYEPKKSLQYRLNMAQRWINKLHQQSRIDKDEWSIVNEKNCCS